MLSIALLGTPALTLAGSPLPVTRRKSRAILYYLAAHDRPLTRDQLLAFFWPDLDRAAAQQTLRTTLHGLRKALGEHLLIEDDTLSFSTDTRIDVHQFRSALSQHASHLTSNLQLLTATLQLYRADFLSGFTLPDLPTFDDWAATEREHYRRLAVRGFSTLSQLNESNGTYTTALDSLEHALAFDPMQEDLQRAAMRLHYLAGNRAAAIRRYDSLRKLLDEEMGVPPMAETRAVYDAIINDKLETQNPKSQESKNHKQTSQLQGQISNASRLILSSPPLPRSSVPLPFTGRDQELEQLQMLTAAHRLVLLEGEPGIGKTRLAHEYLHSVNTIPLIGSAHELEAALPYQPIIEALRSLLTRADWPALQAAIRANLPPVWLAESLRLLPELDPASETPARRVVGPTDEPRLWEGLHQLLRTLATLHPVTLFIDDLQWADSATLALLGYLVRQPLEDIFYLAAARPVPPRSPLATLLQTLTRENRFGHLPLQRLTSQHIATLTQNFCSDNADALTEWLTRTSEGNPYVLAELLRYAAEQGYLVEGHVDIEALSKSPVVPQTIYTLTQSRLNRLSESARRVLDAAVAIGREFEFDVVYRAAGLSEAAALDSVDELRAAGLIHPVDWSASKSTRLLYQFDHSVTMEVAYREVGEARHRILHRRVAEALESLPGRSRDDTLAGLIASHFGEGQSPDQAAPYAIRAGDQAMRLAAWREAADFYDQALAADLDEKVRREVNMKLGEARFRASETAQATEAFRAALSASVPESDDANLARLALARSLFTQARFGEAVELIQQIHTTDSSIAAQREFAWGAALSIEGADLAAATEHLRLAQTLLHQSGLPSDLPVLAQTHFELGNVSAQQGDLEQAVALYREALDIAEEAPDNLGLPQRLLALNNLGYHLHLLSDPSAIEFAQSGLRLAQDNGIVPMQMFLFSTLGEIALAAQQLDQAESYFNEGLAIAERLSNPERIAGLNANLGLVARARGQTDLAIHRLSTALARADSLGTRHLATQIRIWLAPLLPAPVAQMYLSEARAFAESSGRKRLLEEIQRLETQPPTT
jgi:DNA-binding SARP family transcriptional activator/tetratricopeptide (TPR) repeat protein